MTDRGQTEVSFPSVNARILHPVKHMGCICSRIPVKGVMNCHEACLETQLYSRSCPPATTMQNVRAELCVDAIFKTSAETQPRAALRALRMTSSAIVGYLTLLRLQWKLPLLRCRGRHDMTSQFCVVTGRLARRRVLHKEARTKHSAFGLQWK